MCVGCTCVESHGLECGKLWLNEFHAAAFAFFVLGTQDRARERGCSVLFGHQKKALLAPADRFQKYVDRREEDVQKITISKLEDRVQSSCRW